MTSKQELKHKLRQHGIDIGTKQLDRAMRYYNGFAMPLSERFKRVVAEPEDFVNYLNNEYLEWRT